MTRDDVRELIAYAAWYHIDVIPEQEAFGHLHHVLKYGDTTPVNAQTIEDLNDIASPLNGRINDLKEGYVLGREAYEHAWGNENRPTYLGNLTNRYDAAAQLWIQRSDQVRAAIAQFRRTKTLPPMEQPGMPRPAPVP